MSDEIRVYEGIAERTGNVVDRHSLRGRTGVCRGIAELTRKVRRLGDGYYYLPVQVWPEGVTQLPLLEEWTPMGSTD